MCNVSVMYVWCMYTHATHAHACKHASLCVHMWKLEVNFVYLALQLCISYSLRQSPTLNVKLAILS